MLEVFPSINCHSGDFGCVKDKVRKAEAFAEWVHLDVADGVLTFNKSWNDPEAWRSLHTTLKLEVHLMVQDPEAAAGPWLEAGAKRIVVHIETIRNSEVLDRVLVRAAKHGAEVVLAVNPETPLDTLKPYLGRVSKFQIFSQAHLGPPHQKFLPSVLPKIRALRQEVPGGTIEVDGGINMETARLVREAGADIVVAGSYTLGSPDPKRAYEELRAVS